MHGKVDLMDTEDGRYVTTDDLVNELLRILNHKVKAGECDTKDSDALAARDWRSPKDVLRHVDFLKGSIVLVQIFLDKKDTAYLKFEAPMTKCPTSSRAR